MRAESRHGSDRQKGAVPAGSHEVPMALTWEADHLYTLHISCYPIKYFLFMTGSTATHALLEDAASNPFQHTDNFRTQICPSSPGTTQLCFSSFVALSLSMAHCADSQHCSHRSWTDQQAKTSQHTLLRTSLVLNSAADTPNSGSARKHSCPFVVAQYSEARLDRHYSKLQFQVPS